MLHNYFSIPEQKKLLTTIAQYSDVYARRDHAWISALLHSGLRVGEFALSTVGAAQLALRSKYWFIPRENRKGKTRDHRVFVTQALRQDIEALLRIRDEITGAAPDSPHDALVVSRQSGAAGQPMSVRSYQKRLEQWTREAGLQLQVTPHGLRHSRAMNIMRNSKAQDPRMIAKEALGHVSIASTGVYTGVLREEFEGALEEVDRQPGKRKSVAALRREHSDFHQS